MQTEFVLSVVIALCVFLPRVMGQCDQGLDCGEQQEETVVMTSVAWCPNIGGESLPYRSKQKQQFVGAWARTADTVESSKLEPFHTRRALGRNHPPVFVVWRGTAPSDGKKHQLQDHGFFWRFSHEAGTGRNHPPVLVIWRGTAPSGGKKHQLQDHGFFWRFSHAADLGEEMHFELGSWLRRRYSNLLPATYNLRDIYVLSTDLDRTLMSAESNLAGLYPSTDPTSPLRAQPVPIRSRPARDDDLIGGGKPCPRLYQLMRLVLSSPGVDCIRKNFDTDFQYIRLHMGVDNVGIIEACLLQDVLTIEQVHNMTLPEWTEGLDRMRLESLMNFVVGVLPSATREIQRLNSGNLIGELINHMVQKRNNSLSPNREMFMYSAHDITLSGIQMALGVYEAYPIPFAAAVLIELLVDQQQKYYVKVFYRNSTEHEPYLLTLPKCSSSCPLDTFIQLTRDLIPQDWKKECELRSTDKELKLRMPNIGNMVEWLDCFQKYGNIDHENQVN
uniref:acid phosphatase n=1 Tax=Timema monikensis TaxID=170555 RepID=A0A7R9E9K6_9NEOP|nr:unnamed protein product [Timema monikensis]